MPAVPASNNMAAAAGAASAQAAVAGAPGMPDKVARPTAVRRKQGKIDYDNNIARKKVEMKDLSRELRRTKADSRNEKRKKQRLVRKAAQLTIQDLHRIAALKAGIWDPALGLADVPWAGADNAAAAVTGEVLPPKDNTDTSGTAVALPHSSQVDLVPKDADPATPVAVPMSVDAPDEGSDVEEAPS